MERKAQGNCPCHLSPTANPVSCLSYNRESPNAILLKARDQATLRVNSILPREKNPMPEFIETWYSWT